MALSDPLSSFRVFVNEVGNGDFVVNAEEETGRREERITFVVKGVWGQKEETSVVEMLGERKNMGWSHVFKEKGRDGKRPVVVLEGCDNS